MAKKKRARGQFVVVFTSGSTYHRERSPGIAACNVGGRLGEGGTRAPVSTVRYDRRPCGRCYG